MNTTLATEVARLEKMSVNQLAQRFEEVFGEKCRSRHKRYLIRRIAWPSGGTPPTPVPKTRSA